jgi:hypothetical protein
MSLSVSSNPDFPPSNSDFPFLLMEPFSQLEMPFPFFKLPIFCPFGSI